MKYKGVITCVAIVILCISCSQDNAQKSKTLSLENVPEEIRNLESLSVFDSDSEPTEKITFKETVRFGEIYPALLPPTMGFGPLNAVDENGRFYRAIRAQNLISVYNSEGSKITDIGRKGRGPGEFLSITSVYVLADKIFVFDSNLFRLSIFSINNYELQKIINFDAKYDLKKLEGIKFNRPVSVVPFSEKTLLIALLLEDEKVNYGYYQIDYEGKIISYKKVLEQYPHAGHNGRLKNGGLAGIRLPFTPKILMTVASLSIYYVDTKEILIKILNSDLEYEKAFYHPFDNDPLEEQEVLNAFHPNLHSVVKSADYPETWPALDNLLVDDEGRIWISKIIDDKSKHEWDVLEKSGEIKTRFDWPADEPIIFVKKGKLYSEKEDEDIGGKVIVAYNFSFEGL